VNGNPVLPDFGPGPGEAVTRRMASAPSFVLVKSREKSTSRSTRGGIYERLGSTFPRPRLHV
jgi:hypothetical protein